MKLNPPLRRKGVEVTTINEVASTIHFVVHAKATPSDAHTMEFLAHVTSRVNEMMKYLEMEGYIDLKKNWLTHKGIILHPPGDDSSIYQPA
jgi:ribosomal protein S15P/S13E